MEKIADQEDDPIAISMFERRVDVWRVQGHWPFPRIDQRGHVVKLRRVTPPFDINKCEEAFL
jgi:hypothetical protein